MLPLSSAEIKRLSPTTISTLAFGVRYVPQFALLDRIGSVVDAILRTNGTPFGPERFPFSQQDPNSSLLTDAEGSVLRISAQDTILQIPLNTRNLDRVHDLGEDFDRYVLRPLRELTKLSGIARYGVMLTMSDLESLQRSPLEHYLASDFPEANSLAMRFTRRLPSEEALLRKRVEDFKNVIYALREPEEGKITLSIDYQEYFNPTLDTGEWAEKPFPKFVNRGLAYYEGEFQRWFKNLVGVAEVA